MLFVQRLAPIQITSYGHSVSTHGAKIDYFLTGGQVEIVDFVPQNISMPNFPKFQFNENHLSRTRHPHYSETMVLMPGLGIMNGRPSWQPAKHVLSSRRTLAQSRRPRPFIINLSWTATKINFDHLTRLKTILDRVNQHFKETAAAAHGEADDEESAGPRILFRFFVFFSNSFPYVRLAFQSALFDFFGEHAEIVEGKPGPDFILHAAQHCTLPFARLCSLIVTHLFVFYLHRVGLGGTRYLDALSQVSRAVCQIVPIAVLACVGPLIFGFVSLWWM